MEATPRGVSNSVDSVSTREGVKVVLIRVRVETFSHMFLLHNFLCVIKKLRFHSLHMCSKKQNKTKIPTLLTLPPSERIFTFHVSTQFTSILTRSRSFPVKGCTSIHTEFPPHL